MGLTEDYPKYRSMGAYHWNAYESGGTYCKHVDAVVAEFESCIPPGAAVLDVGGGDGLVAHHLGRIASVTLIDADVTGVEIAKERGVEAQALSVYDIHGATGTFYAAYVGDVIEHLIWPEKALGRIALCTDLIYLATPPAGPVLGKHHVREWTEGSLDVFMRGLGWQPKGTSTRHDRIVGWFRKT